MLDFQAITLLHRHGNGEYAGMTERSEHSASGQDPERQWVKGSRIFSCTECTDEIVVLPSADSSRGAGKPGA